VHPVLGARATPNALASPPDCPPPKKPQTHLRDFLVWFTAFICTLFLGAELGLGISIGLALVIVILESAFPHTAVLGQIERTTVYR
jgi:MFS superfamily sulfate permease-like transporter